MNAFSKIFLLASICVLFFSPAGAVEQVQTEAIDNFGEWMEYYYLTKNYSEVPSFLQALQQNQILDNKPSAIPGVTGFLAVIFLENSLHVRQWTSSCSLTGNTKKVVERALWLSGNVEVIPNTSTELPNYANSNPPNVKEFNPKTAADLDFLWGAFYGSGNEIFVEKIINTLDDTNVLSNNNKLNDKIIRNTAAWTLASNMLKHDIVNRTISNESKTRSGTIRMKLEEIIATGVKNNKQ